MNRTMHCETPILKLLRSPEPIEGESWPGYLLRLSNDNDLESLQWLTKLLGGGTSRLLAIAPDAPRADFASVVQSLNERREQPQPKLRLGHLGRSLRTRICVACLRSDKRPFLRSCWDSAFPGVCAIHGCALTESCDACGKAISVERRRVVRCDCGRDLRQMQLAAPDGVLVAIRSICGLAPVCSKLDTFASTPALELQAAKLLRRLQRMMLTPREGGATRVNAAGECFAPSESVRSLHAVLHDIPAMLQKLDATVGRLAANRWISDVQRSLSAAPLCREITLARARSKELSYLSPSRPLMPRQHLSMKGLKRATGLHHDAIHHLIRSGRLGAVEVLMRGNAKSYRFEERSVQRAIQLTRHTASFRMIEQDTGLPRHVTAHLAKEGWLRTIEFGKAAYCWRVPTVDYFGLVHKLLQRSKRSRPDIDQRCLVRLDVALDRAVRSRRKYLSVLLHGVLSAELKVHTLTSSPTRIQDLFLDQAQVDSFSRRVVKPARP
jgi:hypothetical protein